MHYKNGREAKTGDKVFNIPNGIVGILHTVNAKSDSCNGRLAKTDQNDAYITLKECLHVEDIAKAEIPLALPAVTDSVPPVSSQRGPTSIASPESITRSPVGLVWSGSLKS